MNGLQTTAESHGFLLWGILVVVVFVLAVWVWRAERRTREVETRVEEIFREASGENVVRLLAEYLGTVRSTASAVSQMKSEHDRIATIMPSVIRHVGLIRFSPFRDTGGDQSFALALLDGQGDGVVITALHSRNDSRLYAKPVERGNSSYSLTPEEREAMQCAMRSQAIPAR
jgi:Protein of unknown function (DUF4446)